MLHWLPAILALTVLFVSSRAEAYPWMIKHGYTNCAGCHADPSGGELLTLYGHAISYEALSTHWGGKSSSAAAQERRRVAEAIAHAAAGKGAKKAAADDDSDDLEEDDADEDEASADADDKNADAGDEEQAEEGEESESAEDEASESSESSKEEPSPFEGMSGLTGPLFGLLPPKENVLIGGSWRFATSYKDSDAKFFPMQLDLYGQLRFGSHLRVSASVGAAKVPAGSPHARAAQVTTNQGDGYNLISRTHWIGWDFGDGAHTVRAGRLNLPFGLRMSEHVMWIREQTQTDRESDQQDGVSLYMGFDKFRFEVMAILGNYQINERFRERGYSGYLELVVGERATVGASSLYTEAKSDRVYPEGLRTARSAHGLFMRASPGTAVAFLAEANILTRSRRQMGYVGFLQADVEVLSGLHLIGTGEVYDAGWNGGPTKSIARSEGQGQPAVGGWLSMQWFFLPHFDFRVDGIIRSEKEILGQLHVYL